MKRLGRIRWYWLGTIGEAISVFDAYKKIAKRSEIINSIRSLYRRELIGPEITEQKRLSVLIKILSPLIEGKYAYVLS